MEKEGIRTILRFFFYFVIATEDLITFLITVVCVQYLMNGEISGIYHLIYSPLLSMYIQLLSSLLDWFAVFLNFGSKRFPLIINSITCFSIAMTGLFVSVSNAPRQIEILELIYSLSKLIISFWLTYIYLITNKVHDE